MKTAKRPTTLADKIRECVSARDVRLAGEIAEFARFRLGWSHRRLAREVEAKTGFSAAEWDGLLFEADEIEGREG